MSIDGGVVVPKITRGVGALALRERDSGIIQVLPAASVDDERHHR